MWTGLIAGLLLIGLILFFFSKIRRGKIGIKLRANLIARGISTYEETPAILNRFDRIGSHRRDKHHRHGQYLPRDRHRPRDKQSPHDQHHRHDPHDTLWYAVVDRSCSAHIYETRDRSFWLAWQTSRPRKGAIALRPHLNHLYALNLASTLYGSMGLIKADTMPEPYNTLDIFIEDADAASIFFMTPIGANFLAMLDKDPAFAIEYQDGYCRLRFDPSRPLFQLGQRLDELLKLRRSLDEILQTDQAAVPYDCQILPLQGLVLEDATGIPARREVMIYGFSARR